MIHQMQLVRKGDGEIWKPVADVITEAGVIDFMNEFNLGGIIEVAPVSGYGDFSFRVTFAFDGTDAIGEATYLTTFDPHREFPHLYRRSAPVPEPRLS